MKRGMVLALLMVMIVPMTKAHAQACAGSTSASASNPHIVDGTGDWEGNLGAHSRTDSAVPAGDVWREGTDITKAWISGTSGHLQAHIEVANLSKLQRGVEFFFSWTYGAVPPNALDVNGENPAVRYVQVTLDGYQEEYIWGYGGDPNAAGIRPFRTEGNTTGSIVEGVNGLITIDIPATGTGEVSRSSAAAWGAPNVGDTVSSLLATSYVLAGSPETLPSNPAGLRHGLLELADDTTDGTGPDGDDVCEVVIDG